VTVGVHAEAAEDLPTAATVRCDDLRTIPEVRAGAFAWGGPDVVTGWHLHPYHQVEYALQGTAEVHTAAGHHLLPPQQAIWIPAGLPHNTTLRGVQSVAVFFDPTMIEGPLDRACVLPAEPVVREMIAYSQRWPIGRAGPTSSDGADSFFEALAHLVGQWLGRTVPLCLPVTTDPLLAQVLAYTSDHLATVTATSVCRDVGISPRTLRRRFAAVLGTGWQAYVQQSRVLRATALLASGDLGVAQVALAVGFQSPSAFNRAFHRLMGESPSDFRRRSHAG
jgi:AraC-like DNA-binding protein